MATSDRRRAGFKRRTRLADARARLREACTPHGRTESVPVSNADERTLAEPVTASRDVPHYRQAAVDGYAVRATDSFGAGSRSPVVLRLAEGDAPDSGEACRVDAGNPLPPGTDAVVAVEHTEVVGGGGEGSGGGGGSGDGGGCGGGEDGGGDEAVDTEVEVFDAVAASENVGAVGEDVRAGQSLYDHGHRLRPSDLGLLRATGVEAVEVSERPTVVVVPTGAEVVRSDPRPGEVVETNGLAVSRLAERWGAAVTLRETVPDADSLRAAIEREATGSADANADTDVNTDVLVTIGGTAHGETDLVPDVVADCGELLVHGVALEPGHSVALGSVEGTAVVMLPGSPGSCIVAAQQFLRPALAWVGGVPAEDLPARKVRLGHKLRSEPGVRTFTRVRLERLENELVAEPVHSNGPDRRSSVALADGWVEVPESAEGIAAGETVSVERWEGWP